MLFKKEKYMTGKRIKRIRRITDSETRKRIKRFRKQKSPEYKIDQLWAGKRKLFSARSLVFIAGDMKYPKLQKAALKEFLERKNLNFDDFYQALSLPSEVLSLDTNLENKLWKECLVLCTPDNLVELIGLGEKKAAKELFHRIKTKSISERKAKQILIWLIEKTYDKRLSKRLWKEIEKIGPNEQELKHLLDLVDSHKIRFMHKLPIRIEHLLAKIAKRKTGKTIIRFQELVKQIKIKKGQS